MVDPRITFRIGGSSLVGTGVYDSFSDTLQALSIWHDGDWVGVDELGELTLPLELTALPSIDGHPAVRFLLSDAGADEASRMRETDPSPSSAAGGGIVQKVVRWLDRQDDLLKILRTEIGTRERPA
jgi:hypothetical protein